MVATRHIESLLYKKGHILVCGIDEVGRGSLAGPLVASSVILPKSHKLLLDDSKKLSSNVRLKLSEEIKDKAVAFGVGWVSNEEIDNYGLTYSVQLAYIRALEEMNCGFSLAIIDGNYDYLSEYEVASTLIAADSKVACVAAASILAKVERDLFMKTQSEQYKDYDFDNNVGYGTKNHTDAIKSLGLCSLHRKSFCRRFI